MPDATHKPNRTNGTLRSHRRTTGLETASPQQWLGSNNDPDVMLSVPDLSLGKLTLKVKELRADVDLRARVLDLLDLQVGARVTLGEVELDIENLTAQAMLKVRLDTVAEVVKHVMQTITENPELVTSAVSVGVPADQELGTPIVRDLGGKHGARGAEAKADDAPPARRVGQRPKATPKRERRKSTTIRVQGSRE
jgi:hypothetical protein